MYKFYCNNCNKIEEYYIKNATFNKYKGYNLNVNIKIAVCSNCDNEIFVPELEEKNLTKIYAAYRKCICWFD